MGRHLSNKYGLNLFDTAKKSTTDATKTASKRSIQKTAEATGDLICNKIKDKITSVSKNNEANDESEVSKKRFTSPEERQQTIDELRLV